MSASDKGASSAAQVGETGAQAQAVDMRMAVLAMQAMTCGSCEGKIRSTLSELEGVRRVGVDLASALVFVELKGDKADPEGYAAAVADAG